MKSNPPLRLAFVVFAIAMFSGFWPADGATLTVTNRADSGPGTLRQVIADAAPDDSINFDVTGVIALTNGEVVIDKSLTLAGPGAALLTISGSGSSRVFRITGGTNAISGLTLSDGFTVGGLGGAIRNDGTLTLEACVMTNCYASSPSGLGGAIFNGANLTIKKCTMVRNRARAGGGVFNNGTLTVSLSTFSGNHALSDFYVGQGGGIYSGAGLDIESCTFAANGADYQGGNIFSSDGPDGPLPTIRNTIVANTVSAQDIFGAFRSLGYNLIGFSDDSTGFTNGLNHDLVGTLGAPINPRLGPLFDNGGPTPTHQLRANSPAVDQGSSGALTADQRGRTRPFDFAFIGNANDGSDIGAFELDDTVPTGNLLTVTNLADDGPGTLRQILREAHRYDTIQFGVAGTIALTNGELIIDKDLTIRGPGAAVLTVSAETNSRVLTVQAGVATLSGLTLANGANWQTHGGGIVNHDVLTLSNCVVANNFTPASFVSASGNGGGILNYGDLLVVGCTLRDNRATTGGGLFNAGTAVLRNSTVSGNLSGLQLLGPGGGIANFGNLNVEHCTIAGNFADLVGGGGGGIYSPAGTVTIRGSIVAANDDYLNDAPDVSGAFTSLGFNLIGATNGAAGFINGSNHDLAGNAGARIDPKLGPLMDNGGPTPTLALLLGSPAIDAGNAPDAEMDQRGQPRRVNFPAYANTGDGTDVGAFELQESAQSGGVLVVNTLDDVNDGMAGIAHCSLREAVATAATSAVPATIIFEPGFPGRVTPLTGVITLTNGQLTIDRGLQLLGSTNRIVIAGYGTSRLVEISAASTGTVVISNLTLVKGNAGGANGGAILNQASLTLSRCTFATNQASSGGAIFCGNGAQLTLDHCTFSRNTAATGGGALASDGGTNLLLHCTFTANSAASGGGVINQNGVITLRNTVIGGNSATTAPDGQGELVSDDFNLIGSLSGVTLSGTTAHTLTGINPLLAPLADNGGPTPTHLPLAGSPLIDAGNTDGEPIDQRGIRRLADMTGVANAADGGDIGAVEYDLVQSGPTLLVNTLDDVDDGMATIGHCSLREALVAANHSSVQLITFATNVIGAIDLMQVLPVISNSVVIVGPGSPVLTVRRSSGGEYGIFTVGSNATVAISGLSISGAFFNEIAGSGGGVHNDGSLTLQGCFIQNNRAYYGAGILNAGTLTVLGCIVSGNQCIEDGEGGGIYNTSSGSLTLGISAVTQNAAGNDLSSGGGIYNAGGALRITNSLIAANNALGEGAGGGVYNRAGGTINLVETTVAGNQAYAGGGVLNEGGVVTAERCTFSFNAAPEDDGGGIWNSGALTLVNSTVFGNESDFSGGGIYAAGTVTIASCTISSNFAFNGGGIAGAATLRNSVLAGNGTYTLAGHGPDCDGAIVSDDFNLFQRIAGMTITGATAHNLLGLDPKLGPLADNGGTTFTCALLDGSPAIDRGHGSGLTVDQRGQARSIENADFSNASSGDGTDIGAFEAGTNVSDGLPDAWELQYFGSTGYGPIDDVDQDGMSNADEYAAGTNPASAASVLRLSIVLQTGANAVLRFDTVAGKNYEVSFKDDLSDAIWASFAGIQGTGGTVLLTNSSSSSATRFYRLAVQP